MVCLVCVRKPQTTQKFKLNVTIPA